MNSFICLLRLQKINFQLLLSTLTISFSFICRRKVQYFLFRRSFKLREEVENSKEDGGIISITKPNLKRENNTNEFKVDVLQDENFPFPYNSI